MFGCLKREGDGQDMLRVRGRREAYKGFGWRNPRERDHLGDPGIDVRITLRGIFRKWDVGNMTGSSWLKIGTVGGRL